MHNLSERQLCFYEKSILEKGLNFVIFDSNNNTTKDNLEHIDKFERNLQIKLYF